MPNSYCMQIHELVPDGLNIAVTNENKISYLNYLAQFHLCHNVQEEVQAFISGLTLLIPSRLLMMFDENELEVSVTNNSNLKHM